MTKYLVLAADDGRGIIEKVYDSVDDLLVGTWGSPFREQVEVHIRRWDVSSSLGDVLGIHVRGQVYVIKYSFNSVVLF